MDTQVLTLEMVCNRLGFIGKAMWLGNDPSDQFQSTFYRYSKAIHDAICSQLGRDPIVFSWKRIFRVMDTSLVADPQVQELYVQYVKWLAGYGDKLAEVAGIETEAMGCPDWIISVQEDDPAGVMYIDTCSYDDFDRVIRFLLEHHIEIVERDKMKMVVAAVISAELLRQMQDEVRFDESVSFGPTPLEG